MRLSQFTDEINMSENTEKSSGIDTQYFADLMLKFRQESKSRAPSNPDARRERPSPRGGQPKQGKMTFAAIHALGIDPEAEGWETPEQCTSDQLRKHALKQAFWRTAMTYAADIAKKGLSPNAPISYVAADGSVMPVGRVGNVTRQILWKLLEASISKPEVVRLVFDEIQVIDQMNNGKMLEGRTPDEIFQPMMLEFKKKQTTSELGL